MKKILALTLSLLMVFTVIPMTIISASAEEAYDYYTVLDADTYTGTIGGGGAANAYQDGVSRAYNVSITNEANPITSAQAEHGTNAFKIKRTGTFDASSLNYYDSANLSTLAKDSVGFRAWVAAEPGNDKCVTSKNILAFAFDSVTSDGETTTHKMYATADWGNPYLGKLTTEGAWYTFMWGSKPMNTGSNYIGNNRLTYGDGASKSNIIDEAFLANIQGIYLGFNDAYQNGSVYYVDDLQFVYPKGKSPSSSTSPVTMKSGAAIRLNEQNGIRFYTTVDTKKLEELKKVEGNVVELGTLIAPADLVTGELTHSIGEANYVDVPYKNEAYFEDTTFVGSIVNIQDRNIGRKFIGRGYVKVTNGETETYYYATQNDNERSLKSVAASYQGTDDYNLKSKEIKDLVDNWASAADWSAQ